MKRVKDMTSKELWLVGNLLWDAQQKVERIMTYDDNNEYEQPMIVLSESPDEIDNLICDIHYSINTLCLKLDSETKKRSGRA